MNQFLSRLGLRSRIHLYLLIRYWRYPIFANRVMKESQSQICQESFVICELRKLRKPFESGFFVEFGATDGRALSNTYLLEKKFNWNGILVEPARVWHKEISTNRSCFIDFRCVSSSSGNSATFIESPQPVYSTMLNFAKSDLHADKRLSGSNYNVETLSLNDLLDAYHAPHVIDYLSIDTEGSEYEILKHCDFTRWKFRIITVEHNYNSNRDLIYDLLTCNGYIRVMSGKTYMDDWYIASNQSIG